MTRAEWRVRQAKAYADVLAAGRQVTGRSVEQRWCVMQHAAGILAADDWRKMQVPA